MSFLESIHRDRPIFIDGVRKYHRVGAWKDKTIHARADKAQYYEPAICGLKPKGMTDAKWWFIATARPITCEKCLMRLAEWVLTDRKFVVTRRRKPK
jgi:hypothetical protein